MSDDNEPNNPYHPPLLSDKPLAKAGTDSPNAKLHPVHLLFPLVGYAYIPVVFTLAYLFAAPGVDEKYLDVLFASSFYLLFPGLPLYAGVLLFLDHARKKRGRNSCAFVIYHGLSLLLPVLWFTFCGWMLAGGRIS